MKISKKGIFFIFHGKRKKEGVLWPTTLPHPLRPLCRGLRGRAPILFFDEATNYFFMHPTEEEVKDRTVGR
ncbi:hypothetical protein MBAV_001387 [Candidatus Magnetobacterium bavaricum]|uniref:Uncharacterized protein n=1 Tax=Candidatus Magnetobacterium bavaricum TaxID=29290 RepID=A0A0F3H0H5_9BACT|nr:hypothetical protein MBAV_001387 [Candidatus Magnetobacterium bavaricum]